MAYFHAFLAFETGISDSKHIYGHKHIQFFLTTKTFTLHICLSVEKYTLDMDVMRFRASGLCLFNYRMVNPHDCWLVISHVILLYVPVISL